jgi:asparagine synthase (glutamine-hydrolysing)
MCGIAGLYYYDRQHPVQAEPIQRMMDTLRHRGPDDEGHWLGPGVGLGFRRLSIIDLSSAGHQPMPNEDETVWLVFNGEIYNFRELRRELEMKGYRFRSATDSEVLVHGYEAWGDRVLERLHGMFAFAIWDQRRERLFLARDPFGIKPLHYALLPDGLAFASEIKALLHYPTVDSTLDLQAVWSFLTFGQVPAPQTIYRGIRKLPPGHFMECHGSRCHVEPYFRLPTGRQPAPEQDNLPERLGVLLDEAVRRHLVADVPVGCFLSGGLDSSLIAALAARHTTGRLKTFSVTFPGQPQDESEYQQRMVAFTGADHTWIEGRTDLADDLPALLDATDEPFAISSFLPLRHLAAEAARKVKVILSGDGSDELLAGYSYRYDFEQRHALALASFRHIPVDADNDVSLWHNRRLIQRISRMSRFARMNERERYVQSYNRFTDREKLALLQPDVLLNLEPRFDKYIEGAFDDNEPDGLERKLAFEMRTCLADEMMTKLDRATSAVSIEGRVPFLDRNFAEFAWQMPVNRLWHNGEGKRLLKEAARGVIPDEIIDRPKAGFNVPVADWLRADRLFLAPALEEPHVEFDALIRPEAVRTMLSAHRNGTGEHGERLWLLYVLKQWMTWNKVRW